MPPQKRHRVLLETFDDLEPGRDSSSSTITIRNRSRTRSVRLGERRSSGSIEVESLGSGQSRSSKRTFPRGYRRCLHQVRRSKDPETGATSDHPSSVRDAAGRSDDGDRCTTRATAVTTGVHATVRRFVQLGRGRIGTRALSRQITKGEESNDADAAGEIESSAAPADSDSITVTEELDVRDRPPAERHELIFEAYEDLKGEQAFVLVNDHDPKPLYHQFEAEAGSEFQWEYQKKEPGEFRVLIGKSENRTREPDANESVNSPFWYRL